MISAARFSSCSTTGPRLIARLSVLVVLVLHAGGCGRSSGTVPVRGSVTYKGEAVDSGAIAFYPPAGRPIMVPLSSEGQYHAMLEPGEYIVTVTVANPLPPGFKEGDPMPPPRIVLPMEYTTRARSTLGATVAADQSVPIDFVLE